ncbi:hypothetical protein KGD83_10270 [Nocardiopsis akebiae]|uniref:Uncharacterized protein n=1 Tax=Nocardiopsis akebiae TaxID=2831968 RepID=A0ABX8CBB7_9ACTN|nr:hypothetical protein [Nocardiopsis akebiae]QUX30839.1 hypothetical protein KGD83_10270 [Nocardiopsis akebiae]
MALAVAPEVFPWTRFLPEQDAETFLAELAELLHAIEELDTNAPVLTPVTQWKHAAEVYAHPEALEALTRERDPDADFGPVPPPGGGMSPKRGDRVAPPPKKGEYEIRFQNA